MNVLVLGAGGYTGARLTRALLEQGHRVRGLVHQVEAGIELEKEGMDLRVGDLRDLESIRAIGDDIQVVFNVVGYCRAEPASSRAILNDGTRNIFRVVERNALRKYIWSSNVSVYGSPRSTDRLDESSPFKPSYGLGRLTQDVEKLAQDSGPSVAMRVASVYGPGRDSLAALREGRLRLLNDGENWQSRIHVDDLVRALLAAMGRAAPGSVYLAADDLPMKQREFFQELAAAIKVPLPLPLEARAAKAYGVFGRAMNALAGEQQYQLSENVIGLLSGNYYCLNVRMKRDLGVTLQYPTFREGYREILGAGALL